MNRIKNVLTGLSLMLLSTSFSTEGLIMNNRISDFRYDSQLQNNGRLKSNLPGFASTTLQLPKVNRYAFSTGETPFVKNRRNLYSSLWGFASLNYLYADLVGLMDANILKQYQTGVVNDIAITPNFLTVAAGFMQIPIANVFLPHIIKNDRTLRWIQIASGSIMTLVQTSTLFVGKPTPYYALFSAFEIAATTFITIDAIKWKPNPKQLNHPKNL